MGEHRFRHQVTDVGSRLGCCSDNHQSSDEASTLEAKLTAEKFTTAFIDGYVQSRGLPVSIVSDRDIRFTSSFWQLL